MKTITDLAETYVDAYTEYGHSPVTKRTFTEGEIVEYKAAEPRKGYYKEADTEYDLCAGDLCVIAMFGGPRDMVVDRIVNNEVVRYAVDFKMIKKVKR